MAANKAKRSIHVAQPPKRLRLNPNSTELQQVKPHIYQAIADMNGGFEHVMRSLQTIQDINFLHCSSLKGMRNLIGRLRSQANHELTTVLSEREKANAGHFQRLYVEQESSRLRAS